MIIVSQRFTTDYKEWDTSIEVLTGDVGLCAAMQNNSYKGIFQKGAYS